MISPIINATNEAMSTAPAATSLINRMLGCGCGRNKIQYFFDAGVKHFRQPH